MIEGGTIVGIRESATANIKSAPADVFRTVTDIKRLPEWNTGIVEVVERPDQLQEGSLWKVRVRAMGQSWVSTSTLTELDPESRRFAYRSQSDDGNPSFADWRWQVQPDPSGKGTRVTVEVDVHPRTFLRRRVLSDLRRRGLRKAIEQSLAALQEHAEHAELP